MATATLNEPWLKGKWNELKGRVKEKWGKLTDDDLDKVEGKRDKLLGLIQQRYGESRDKVEQQLEKWEKDQGLR